MNNKSHTSNPSTSEVDKSSNEKVITHSTPKTQLSLSSFLKPYVTNYTQTQPHNPIPEQQPEINNDRNCPKDDVQPSISQSTIAQHQTSTTAPKTTPQPRVTHINPYQPHRRLRQPMRISSTITPKQHSTSLGAAGSTPPTSNPVSAHDEQTAPSQDRNR